MIWWWHDDKMMIRWYNMTIFTLFSPSQDWQPERRDVRGWAQERDGDAQGLLRGTSESPDSENNYHWSSLMTQWWLIIVTKIMTKKTDERDWISPGQVWDNIATRCWLSWKHIVLKQTAVITTIPTTATIIIMITMTMTRPTTTTIPGSPTPGKAGENLVKPIRTGCLLHQVVVSHEVVTLKIGCICICICICICVYICIALHLYTWV